MHVVALVLSPVLAFFPILRMTSKIYRKTTKSYLNEFLGPSPPHPEGGLRVFLLQAGTVRLSMSLSKNVKTQSLFADKARLLVSTPSSGTAPGAV